MIKKIGLFVLVVALGAPTSRSAFALGTPSGTPITNSATVTYIYGGAPATATVNAPAVLVDNRVNLTVTKNGDLTVLPGSANQALLFTVKNEGNTSQRYVLAATKSGGIDMTAPVRIYLDNGTTPGVWDTGDTLYVDAGTFADVPADGTLKVLIVANTPAGATTGQTADYQLTATTVDAGTTAVTLETGGANTAGVDVVFADADPRDGKHSATGIYTVNLALPVALSKAVAVVWDPSNLFVAPKAIAGAKLTYTITATVSGAETATAVVITDPVPAKSSYVAGSLKLNGAALSDVVDGDAGSVGGAPLTVSVGLGDLTSGSAPQVVSFEVTIN
jgi:uncharacterized repeat protein (TIGR01451 family)